MYPHVRLCTYSCLHMYIVQVCVHVCVEVTGQVFVDVRGGRAFDGELCIRVYDISYIGDQKFSSYSCLKF